MTRFNSVSDVLDALAPTVDVEEEAWLDVLARAERLGASSAVNGHAVDVGRSGRPLPQRFGRRPASRQRRGLLLIGLVALTFVLIVATAYALGHPLVDFSSAPPAPPHAVKEFDSLSSGAPPGMDPHVIAGETRLVGNVGGLDLWVAPTKSGGFCLEWREATGGCDAQGTVPLSVTWQSGVGGPAIYGYANARWADNVEVELDDGTTVRPQAIWVSPPIDAGFFYYRPPDGRTIRTVLALNGDDVVAADGKGAPGGPHPFADLSKRDQVAEIETNDGTVTLWTAPTKTEGRCAWIEFQDQELSAAPCLPKGYEHQVGLGYRTRSLGGHTILVGQCGYSAVQFIHGDGTDRSVDCTDGLVFADLQPADIAGEMRALGADGQPVGRGNLVGPPVESGAGGSAGKPIEMVVLMGNGVMTGPARVGGERPYADFSQRTRISHIDTNSGTATLWTAPTKTGGRCTWLEFRGDEIPVAPCTPKGEPHPTRLAFAVFAAAGRNILAGACGYRSLQLVSSHGRARSVDCANGFVFTYLRASDVPGQIRPLAGNGKPSGISLPLLHLPRKSR